MSSPDASTGLPTLESGALFEPVGLGRVSVGPRVFLAACALAALALAPGLPSLAFQLATYVALAAAIGRLIPVLRSWRTVAWVIVSLVVVYAWAYPGNATYVGIFGLEGLRAGAVIAVRLLGFVTVLYTLVLSTGPLALVSWAGSVNEDLGIMLSLTLSVLPVMRDQMHATLAAQQARGMRTDGNLAVKLRAYVAVIVPVVVKSLVRAYGMAALLHARGYGSGRRAVAKRAVGAGEVACYVVGVAWVACAVAARLLLPGLAT